MRHHALAWLAACLAGLALAACAAPRDADFVPSEASRAAPPPRLAETARFDAALAAAGPDTERLAEGADALAGRAAALRSRAAALSAPVLEPGARSRLDAGRAG